MEFEEHEGSPRSDLRSDLDQVEIEIELVGSQDDADQGSVINQKSLKKKGGGGQDQSKASGMDKSGNKKRAGRKTGSNRRGKEAG